MTPQNALSGLFVQLMVWLDDQARVSLQQAGSSGELRALVAPIFPPTQDRELESLLAEDQGDLLERGKFMHLPLVEAESEWLPVLTFSYNFSEGCVALRVGLFRLHDGQEGRLCAVGFRFETPHVPVYPEDPAVQADQGPAGAGRHEFHHAQVITTFDRGAERHSLPTPQWLPTKQPSFPVDGRDYVDLALCMLVSIYGGRGQWIRELRNAKFANMLRPHVRNMACLRNVGAQS